MDCQTFFRKDVVLSYQRILPDYFFGTHHNHDNVLFIGSKFNATIAQSTIPLRFSRMPMSLSIWLRDVNQIDSNFKNSMNQELTLDQLA